MKKVFTAVGILVFLVYVPVFGQEHQHDQRQAQNNAPAQKDADSSGTGSMKCCEGMDKMGEMKQGMPMKGDMKAKMKRWKKNGREDEGDGRHENERHEKRR